MLIVNDRSVLVKFRFEGEVKSQIGELTYEQYNNLKNLPVVVECNIVTNEQPTLTKDDMELINQRILEACKADKTHTSEMAK